MSQLGQARSWQNPRGPHASAFTCRTSLPRWQPGPHTLAPSGGPLSFQGVTGHCQVCSLLYRVQATHTGARGSDGEGKDPGFLPKLFAPPCAPVLGESHFPDPGGRASFQTCQLGRGGRHCQEHPTQRSRLAAKGDEVPPAVMKGRPYRWAVSKHSPATGVSHAWGGLRKYSFRPTWHGPGGTTRHAPEEVLHC